MSAGVAEVKVGTAQSLVLVPGVGWMGWSALPQSFATTTGGMAVQPASVEPQDPGPTQVIVPTCTHVIPADMRDTPLLAENIPASEE